MDIESMARYWTQDAENYGNIIQHELASFRVEAWQKFLQEKMPAGTRRVLDLGCGPGFFSIILLPNFRETVMETHRYNIEGVAV